MAEQGSGELDPYRYALSEEARRQRFEQLILPREIGELRAAPEPQLRYIGGQPGAGKSALQARVVHALAERDGAQAVVEINNDRYRVYHPRYRQLQAEDDQLASFYTNVDCDAWIAQALDLAEQVKPHVLLESSLRRPDSIIETSARFRAAGFRPALDVVAAHEFVSRLSIAQRYLEFVREGEPGRYVLRSTHDDSYQQLPATLERVLDADAFDRITVYNRAGPPLYEYRRGMDQAEVVDAYRHARSVLPEPATNLLPRVDALIELARQPDRQACLHDLEALREDIARA
jgi:hypothetical protein